MLDFYKENTALQKKLSRRNISNIYVSIFGNSLQFFRLMYKWKIWPALYVIFSTTLFNNIMMKISDAHVRLTEYHFREINIHC